MSENKVVLEGYLIDHETDAAILIRDPAYSYYDDDKKTWLPKKFATFHHQRQASPLYDIELPEWLARDKGLI